MKRFVLFVMLFVLPLQFVWAAGALACGHENTGTAGHFGHHSAQKAELSDDRGVGDSQASDDCVVCHLVSFKNYQLTTLHVALTSRQGGFNSQPMFAYSYLPKGPERPNWALAV